MADPVYRIRTTGFGTTPGVTVYVGLPIGRGQAFTDELPAKEFSLVDDMMKTSDAMSFTVANPDGKNTGKFVPGQRVEVDAREQGVAGGVWCQLYTGLITRVNNAARLDGTVIRVECYDLGWFLTTCAAQPLQSTNGVTIGALVHRLVENETTWKFAPTVTIGNALNKKLKQGRTGVVRNQPRNPLQVLPPIQVEPGQTPWSVLEEYCKRAGYLLNVGAKGDLIIFQPDYTPSTHYDSIEFHGIDEGSRSKNNVIDVSLDQSIDGIWSESQCWSTVVVPTPDQQAEISLSPNAQFRSERIINGATVPFNRRVIVMDSEAIDPAMRRNRALWAAQIAQFNAWTYQAMVHGHSSALSENAGVFYASDTMISVNDSVNQVNRMLYVQAVHKSYTEQGGARTKLILRQPNVLNPAELAQV